ncbi:MAG: phenylacetate-CoA oxygenase subunit PaaJ [Chitinophagaceae bacterium]|nr:phenylacetate-CoA oxygenase subunit PaaJ [Chitinophagaceae bacterium]
MVNVLNTEEEIIFTSLQEVMDPEIPVLSVVDLGIIEDVRIEDDSVTIMMLPTFTACPAIRVLQTQIRDKVLSLGYKKVAVQVDGSVAWNSDRITESGKIKLEKFGLGTPLHHGGEFDLSDIEYSICPHCSSSNTTMNSIFGSTLCRSMHFCFDCRQGFERFKPL